MRRLLGFAVPFFVLAAVAVAQVASSSSFSSTAVCDLTTSKTKPYQRVTATSAKQLKTYLAKAADIVPAPRSCPQAVLSPTAGGTAITVTMVGVTEMPDLGDPDGSGTVTLRLRKDQGQVCQAITVQNISTPTASHIHKGGVNDSGPVVVPLMTPTSSGTTSGCVSANRAVVDDILKNRASYYVNVHTGDYPGGALRNQLTGPVPQLLRASMAGLNEKPAGGDSDGTGAGEFILRPDKGQLCYTLAASNINLPATASHIHRGDGTVAGPVIIPFVAPSQNGQAEGCVQVDPGLLNDIVGNPGGFYANIHTTDFPGGAVRAQLEVQR